MYLPRDISIHGIHYKLPSTNELLSGQHVLYAWFFISLLVWYDVQVCPLVDARDLN